MPGRGVGLLLTVDLVVEKEGGSDLHPEAEVAAGTDGPAADIATTGLAQEVGGIQGDLTLILEVLPGPRGGEGPLPPPISPPDHLL